MHRRTGLDAERLAADTRAIVAASRAHILRLQRGLRAERSFMEAVRRDLADWHRALSDDRSRRDRPIIG